MRKITLIALTALLIVSCSTEEVAPTIDSIEVNRIDIDPDPDPDPQPIELASTQLTAGQHFDSGTVTVMSDATGVTVNYDTTGDWILLETHLYVGTIEDLPSTGNGSPKIGHFPYDGEHSGNTTSVSYNVGDIAAGTCTYVFAHAVVYNTVTNQEETAWGAGLEAAGNNWAMYFEACN
jgi:hypothetical protein